MCVVHLCEYILYTLCVCICVSSVLAAHMCIVYMRVVFCRCVCLVYTVCIARVSYLYPYFMCDEYVSVFRLYVCSVYICYVTVYCQPLLCFCCVLGFSVCYTYFSYCSPDTSPKSHSR